MSVLNHYISDSLSRVSASLFHSPGFYGGHYSPLLPQSGIGAAMCLGPILLFQFVIVILLSIFLADRVHDITYGMHKSNTSPKVAESRAQLIASICFVLFTILGCAILLFMYRDFYIP